MHQRWLVDEENLLPHQFLNITHILFFPILTQITFCFLFGIIEVNRLEDLEE